MAKIEIQENYSMSKILKKQTVPYTHGRRAQPETFVSEKSIDTLKQFLTFQHYLNCTIA